jgi:hypothetical protein
VRWQYEGAAISGDAPDDAICLLDVPVHKTGTAFTKPVDPLLGQALEAWQAVRPAQPETLDRKTSEHGAILFAAQATGLDRHLAELEPVLAAIHAAAGGDQGALQQVEVVLNGLADREDWAALAGVLRRVLAGDRDPETLLADLDPVDTAIVTRLLDALAARVQLAANPIREATAAGAQALVDQWEPVLAAILAASAGADQGALQ